MSTNPGILRFAIPILVALVSPGPVWAQPADPAPPAADDEFIQVLEETEQDYLDGKIGDVKENLDYLLQLVAQMRLQLMMAFLPEPLDGWTAAEPQTQNASAFGVGLSVSRVYTSAAGEDLTISIVADSPMLTQLGMLFSNPQLATAGGNTVMRINGEQAIVDQDNVRVGLDNKLVTLEGGASLDNKVSYGETMDFEAIEDFE